MLTIPATVKTVMQTDSTRKNFRVMFKSPRNDLTLSDIVSGSVGFEESMCSQNTLKFGCVEGAVLKFETVGVPNIMGEQFTAGWEFDLSSLSAAQLSAIALNPGDGVYVPLADSDLGFPYYRVPAGAFVVTSCPRNQESREHRQVTAESPSVVSPFTVAQLLSETHKETWTESPRQMAIGILGYAIPNIDTQLGLTATVSKDWTTIKSNLTTFTRTYLGSAGTLTITGRRTYSGLGAQYLTRGSLNLIETSGDWPNEEFYLKFISDMKDAGFTPTGQTQEAFFRTVKAYFMTHYQPALAMGKSASVYPAKERYILDPWGTGSSLDFYDTYVVSEVSYSLVKNGNTLKSGSQGDVNNQSMTISTLTDPNPTTALFTISATSVIQDPDDTPTYGHVDAFDPISIVEGWAEINGWFVSAGRDGNWRLIEGFTGTSLTLDEISSAWWDDYDISEIKKVRYPYTDDIGTNADDYAISSFSMFDDYGIYDITSNSVLTSIENGTRSLVLSMLQTYFIPNLANLVFTPATIEAKNRPDIEAGDKITVNSTFTTLMTRQSIDGEQLLSATMESVSGQTMGD